MHNMREEDVSHTKKDHWRVTKPKQVKALMHKPRAQLEAISLPGDSHYGEFTLLLSSSISSPASPHTALRSGGPWQALCFRHFANTSTRRKRIYASLHSSLLICSCHCHRLINKKYSSFLWRTLATFVPVGHLMFWERKGDTRRCKASPSHVVTRFQPRAFATTSGIHVRTFVIQRSRLLWRAWWRMIYLKRLMLNPIISKACSGAQALTHRRTHADIFKKKTAHLMHRENACRYLSWRANTKI